MKIKTLTILSLALTCFSAWSAPNSLEEKVQLLEGRVKDLEIQLEKKISKCSLNFKHYTYAHNSCPQKTMVTGVTKVADDVYQLRCGYYQLQCENLP